MVTINVSTDKVKSELELGSNLSVTKLVDCLLEYAGKARASDIHIDPGTFIDVTR